MDERTREYIVDFVNECELHIDNALKLYKVNEVKSVQFLNQAFICVQILKKLAFIHNSFYTDQFCRSFWHFNEEFLSEPVNEKTLLRERENLKTASSELYERLGTTLDHSDSK